MAYRLTPAADEDFIAISAEGIRLFGVVQARRYRAEMLECFDLLASQPRMARVRLEFDPPIRAHFHGSHVIAYVEAGDDILILRLFHARQDWRHLL